MSEEMEIADKKDWRELEPNYSLKIFLTFFYSLILVTGIMGNSITIRVTQVLKRNGYLQKNVTDHMVSLACSDLLVLLIGMPVELYSAIWFPFSSAEGNAACKIYNFLFEACSYATILNVATLSFERYVAICHPFRFKALGGKRTSALITFAWLVSVLVALPLLVATGTQGHIPYLADTPVQNLTFCTNLRERWVMYRVSIFVAFIVYMIVLICVAFMCRAMVLVLRKPLGSVDSGISGTQRAHKHEGSKVKTARKQTIIFLGIIQFLLSRCLPGPAPALAPLTATLHLPSPFPRRLCSSAFPGPLHCLAAWIPSSLPNFPPPNKRVFIALGLCPGPLHPPELSHR
uniref:G-protein coupled receptor 39 isoform X2 n=1 Tax=Epinephelus lanceolatus TaxID=310571 RepID=UPI0014455E00|nr:G-protein coupled receptor 39 isoform X2 [Epinephelus lanceolatus]